MTRRIDIETLKERIADKYDPDVLVDLLQVSVHDLLEAFEDRLADNLDLFSELTDYE